MGVVKRTITCTNTDEMTCTFGEAFASPFLLEDCDGVYSVSNTVTMSENKMTDGATYQGSVTKSRNIVLTLRDKTNHVSNRNFLYALFKSKSRGELVLKEDQNERRTDYYVESIESDGVSGSRKYTVSLICDDPFFYDMEDITVYMSAWKSSFRFPHSFVAAKEEFGYKSNVKMQNIVDDIAQDGIGMEIQITCNGPVTNPTITRVESDEHITVGSSAKIFSMVSGDVLLITTGVNDKHLYLTHEGVKAEINEYLTEDSEFIQLFRGDNHIGYSSDTGTDNIVVAITYRLKYAGA